MRVSDYQRHSSFTGDLQNRLSNMLRIQQEMGTGKSIFEPSEDVQRAGKVLKTDRSIAANAQYRRNIEDGRNWINAADSQLQAVVELINDIDALAVAADNSSQNEQDRSNTAIQVDQKLEALAEYLNAQHNDRYLFGGHQTVNPPFSATRDGDGRISGVTANEETLQGRIYRRIGEHEDVQVNVPGTALFQPAGAAGTTNDLVYVVAQLRNTIGNNNQPPEGEESTLSNDVLRSALESIRERIVAQQSYLGAVGQRLNRNEQLLLDQNIDLTDENEQAGGVDLTDLITRLSIEEGAYNALLQLGPRTLSQSLVDYLL